MHVVVTYRRGELDCYLNGRRTDKQSKVEGDFRNWDAQHLLFGDEWTSERNWAGALESVAIYNRCLDSTEVERNAREYARIREMRRSK